MKTDKETEALQILKFILAEIRKMETTEILPTEVLTRIKALATVIHLPKEED